LIIFSLEKICHHVADFIQFLKKSIIVHLSIAISIYTLYNFLINKTGFLDQFSGREIRMKSKTRWFSVLRAGLTFSTVWLMLAPCVQAQADFNHDGRDDIVTFIRSTKGGAGGADVYVALSTGSGFGAGQKWHESFGIEDEIPAMGDVNGDGRADILTFVRRSKNTGSVGKVYAALSNGHGFEGPYIWNDRFCPGDEIPAVGDVNGDGLADLIGFVRSSKSGAEAGDVVVALSTPTGSGPTQRWSDWFCIGNEVPLVGDFNGDHLADIATFIRSTQSGAAEGDVYVSLSTGSSFGAGQKWSDWFCIQGEVPLVGDFNSDGRADVATLIRGTAAAGAAQGDVYVALSDGSRFGPGQKWNDWFCVGNEIPAAGDFNGDGRDDLVTFVQDTQAGDARGDVFVCTSTGSGFSAGARWHSFFCVGDEVPTTASAIFPDIYFPNSTEDNDGRFVGYASSEESRFLDSVRSFQSEFQSTWPAAQIFHGESRFLARDHLAFVDSADLAYIAGHGNASYIVLRTNDPSTLERCAWGSWSSHSRKGDLEYVMFQSCEVLRMDANWQERWKGGPGKIRPFAGLHVACGFRNIHEQSPVYPLADEVAENLEDGYSVQWAWLEAADNEDDCVWFHHNESAVFFLEPYRNETISQHNSRDIWYNDPNYLLRARWW
jgi:hypothetical protein